MSYSQPNAQTEKGIIFSCNDRVYEWTISFLESVREFEPNIPLVLIPYDKYSEKVKALSNKFQFSIFDDGSLEELDEVGRRLHLGATTYAHHSFRRLSAFWGPLQKFIYIDIDIIILHNLDFLFSLYEASNLDIIYYDRELNQVYLEGHYRNMVLSRGRNTGFNSGFWLSRRGLFSKNQIFCLANKAEQYVEDFNIRNADQPFLNFIADETNLKTASFPELRSDLSSSIWVRGKKLVRIPSGYMNWDHGGLNHRKRIVALHWAGTKISPTMPYFNIYLHYRYKSKAKIFRLFYQLKWLILRILKLPLKVCRQNFWINRFYKKLSLGEDVRSPLSVLSGSQH